MVHVNKKLVPRFSVSRGTVLFRPQKDTAPDSTMKT